MDRASCGCMDNGTHTAPPLTLTTAAPQPVRLVVNYPRNRKTVLRVQPIFPLSDLLPEICSKCDLDMNHVEMFSDATETHKLDPASCLRELGFYEIFVIDRSKGVFGVRFCHSPSPTAMHYVY